MKYTLRYLDEYYAKTIYNTYILGDFNNLDTPIQYLPLKYIRTALKTHGQPDVYTYSVANKPLIRIVPKLD